MEICFQIKQELSIHFPVLKGSGLLWFEFMERDY